MTTFRQLAKSLGVSHTTVVKAALTGRLTAESIGCDAQGRRFIRDAELARREFKENASKLPPEREPEPFGDVDVEALVFDLIAFVLVNHLPGAILSTVRGRVDQFDARALAGWLRTTRKPS